MSKPIVIVTSYARPQYLEPCLESLRQDDVHLIVVDGGDSAQSLQIAHRHADRVVSLAGNPGADVLKNEGIALVDQPHFIITSDDLTFPPGYSIALVEQFYRVGSRYVFCACATEEIVRDHSAKFHAVNGVDWLNVGSSMVSGAIMDTAAVRRVGGFPVYGKSGQGDHAISKRLRACGYHVGYFRTPTCRHIGAAKFTDYPEYSQAFATDENQWYARAMADPWKP